MACGLQTLQGAAVLHPRTGGGREAVLSLTLDAKTSLRVEQAVMDIVEL